MGDAGHGRVCDIVDACVYCVCVCVGTYIVCAFPNMMRMLGNMAHVGDSAAHMNWFQSKQRPIVETIG